MAKKFMQVLTNQLGIFHLIMKKGYEKVSSYTYMNNNAKILHNYTKLLDKYHQSGIINE